MPGLVSRFYRRNISVFISCQPSFSGAVPGKKMSRFKEGSSCTYGTVWAQSEAQSFGATGQLPIENEPHESFSRHHHRSRKRSKNRCPPPSKRKLCTSASVYAVSTEKVDACAKQVAAIIGGAPRPVSSTAASALIRRTLTGPPPCHCRKKEVYTETFSLPPRCPLLKTYANQLGMAVDSKCPSCG